MAGEGPDNGSDSGPKVTPESDAGGTETPPEPAPDPDHTVIGSAQPDLPRAAADDATILSSEEDFFDEPGVKLVLPGSLINNNYRIQELISVGGMGEVYRAENVFTGDPVAVKVILANLASSEDVLDMFRREARVLVQLRDEAIVRYHNFVLDPDLERYCLIMEFVPGQHLGDRITAAPRLSDAEVITLTRRLARGLARAHARGVTHRDLSPDNVILRDGRLDEAVLIDFGIARSTELGDGLEGRFAGKFKYIAPEQLGHWQGEIGPRTDIYGLGLLIAAVLRGAPLDMGDSVVSASAARQAIPDLDGISHRLFPLLQHMLEPDPAARPADMGLVRRMLDDPTLIPSRYRLPLWNSGGATAGLGPTTTGGIGAGAGLADATDSSSPFGAILHPSPAPEARPAPPVRRRRLPMLAGGALILALVAGGLWFWRGQNAARISQAPEAAVAPSLPPRDSSTREGFLASQAMPDCAFADRLSSGPRAGQLQVLGLSDLDTAPLLQAYAGQFGVSPSTQRVRLAQPQCDALQFLRQLAGYPAPLIGLQASGQAAEGQLQIRGTVTGLPERSLWLALVPPTGEIYDLSAQLGQTTGENRAFGFALSQPEPGTYLLIAMSTATPVAALAAAPSGVAPDTLLPRVLDEIMASAEAPSISVRAVHAPGDGDDQAQDSEDDLDL